MQTTVKHINSFATEGLRTLAVAVRVLSQEDYESYSKSMIKASQSLEGREAKIRAIYEHLEDNLELIGAIGVEDRLQEGVRETLLALGQAGIKIWILTGDKKETAINISWSCGHLRHDMHIIDIAGLENPETAQRVMEEKIADDQVRKPLCLIVDGTTLTAVFLPTNRSETIPILRTLAKECSSVICCRMSPLQKAEIVAMIKASPDGPVTASIGDGANDVAMIQEAHVGLGIMGKEGRAAVRSSDFAFAKFRHLQRVLLVHGHWYYVRAAILVQYFFYKNVAAFTAQFFMAFFNNFSTQSIYDSINLTLYNITFTSAPIFIYGLLEQNLSAKVLMADPEKYQEIARNRLLAKDKCFLWILEALWHSLVTFFGFYFYWHGHLNQTSSTDSLEMFSFGLVVYQSAVVVVNLRLLVEAKHWNILLVSSVGLSLLFFLCFT
jgi:phospholipid-translocating ATPase